MKQLVEPIMEQPEPRIDYIRRAAERAAEELAQPEDEVVSENYFLTTTELPVYASGSTENYPINRV